MQTRVDKYLSKAFEAIQIVELQKVIDGRNINISFINMDENREQYISKEYKGYISSLGANIIQAGVKAAISFYQAEESGSKSDRRLVNAAIKYIISSDPTLNASGKYDDIDLLALLTNVEESNQQKALDILDAATALKLALRTYKMK